MDVRFPIGELELPNQVSLVDVKRWMSEVERYIDQLKNVVNGISEEELKKRYREGSWTVRQTCPSYCRFSVTVIQPFEISVN